ncbi:peptidase domain-containing ABC transporter [Eilatimonas milleporae]|uniref:Colicin V processing peptidase n=1 Tax=Eilatimonas milleporae TaxID=911205 RepID=A0A3M0CI44_9PROT|nr:peptidase domain-containing ABC transporter [Eilatimonas milleporae]RMB08495.1 colicin V processing peptidase [Eilatimonas milleporae]
MNRLDILTFFAGKTLPIYRQSEVTECGHAALAMVLSYHGREIDLATMRRKFPTSAAGVKLRTLMDMAARMQLTVRALKVPLEQLDKLQTPAILHWDLNHFVVLKAVTRKGVVVHDPAQGARTYTTDEISKHYTGVALELTPEAGFERKVEKTPLRLSDLWSKITGLKRSILHALAMSVVLQLFVLASPFYLQLAVDHVVVKYDEELLLVLALGFGAFTLINAAAEALRGYILLHFGNLLSYQMITNLFGHLLKLPLPFFEKRHIGDIVSRFGSTEPIRRLFTEGMVAVVIDGIMAVTTLIFMFVYSPTLAAIAFLAFALYLGLRWATYRPFHTRSEEQIIASAKEQSTFIETARGVMSLKVFGREHDRKHLWHNRFADVINAGARVEKLRIGFGLGNSLIFGVEHVILIFVAISMVLAGDFTIGMIFAFMAYKRQFSDKAAALVERFIEFRMLDLHLERLSDIALAEPEAAALEDRSLALMRPIDGNITVEDIAFNYGEGLPDVMTNTSLDIGAGQTIAIIGPSGCGKTTLTKIMMGLFMPTKGLIKIDGRPLLEIGIATYRQATAAVMQEDTLFAGTLAENIAFFDTEIDMSRVIDAAQKACIHDEVLAMPMNYESLVGDMGSILSGGQKQRVLLARALYRDPKILFMDEGTAHLDVETERKVNASIRALGMTRIIVAHRPDTIQMADRVFEFSWKGLVELTTEDRKRKHLTLAVSDSVSLSEAEDVSLQTPNPAPKHKSLAGIQAPDF